MDLDDERTMEGIPITEEVPSQPNENDNFASHFALFNTQLDSMDAHLLSHGEQFGVLSK